MGVISSIDQQDERLGTAASDSPGLSGQDAAISALVPVKLSQVEDNTTTWKWIITGVVSAISYSIFAAYLPPLVTISAALLAGAMGYKAADRFLMTDPKKTFTISVPNNWDMKTYKYWHSDRLRYTFITQDAVGNYFFIEPAFPYDEKTGLQPLFDSYIKETLVEDPSAQLIRYDTISLSSGTTARCAILGPLTKDFPFPINMFIVIFKDGDRVQMMFGSGRAETFEKYLATVKSVISTFSFLDS